MEEDDEGRKLDPESEDFDPDLALSPEVSFRTEEDIRPAPSLEELEAQLHSARVLRPSTSTAHAGSGAREPSPQKLPRGKARTESIARILKKTREEEAAVTALVASKPRREAPTIVRRLRAEAFAGPLAVLSACLRDRSPLVVHVRGRDRLRSTLAATLTAFDKHWNLALRNVTEIYYRSKKKAVFRSNRTADYDFAPPNELLFTSLDKHHANHVEKMTRHCDQLFVRGENVILVSVPPSSDSKE